MNNLRGRVQEEGILIVKCLLVNRKELLTVLVLKKHLLIQSWIIKVSTQNKFQ